VPPRRRSQTPADALVGVAPLASRWIERLLAGHAPPLTLAQFSALRAIAAEPVSAVDLARRTGVSGAAVSQLVSTLESAGWVERTPAQPDRRRQRLGLSPVGESVFRSATRLLRGRLGALLGDLPPGESEQLERLLGRVEQALGGSPPPRRPTHPPRASARRPGA
jgi:DNA-binding MarR family transcriptional regulator